jgi:hypothetical protein
MVGRPTDRQDDRRWRRPGGLGILGS